MLLYQKIYSYIKDAILSGVFDEGTRLPTEYEYMTKYDASRTTVRRALNLLKQENLISRSPRSGSYVIHKKTDGPQAVMQNEVKTLFFDIVMPVTQIDIMTIVKGIKTYFSEHNIKSAIHFMYDMSGNSNELEITNELLHKQSDGVIIYPLYSYSCRDMAHRLRLQGIPFVLVDKDISNCSASLVTSDSYNGMYDLTTHLIAKGHTKIAYISTHLSIGSTMRDRLRGYADALRAASIMPKSGYIGILGLRDWHNISSIIEKLLPDKRSPAINEPPTALIYAVDGIIGDCSNHILYRGYRIPEELTVCSMDGSKDLHNIPYPVTTMAQDFYRIGVCAAGMLHELCLTQEKAVKKLFLPCKLIERMIPKK